MRQIHRKYPKSVDKLIVCKFTDRFLSPSVITDGSVGKSVSNYRRIHKSVDKIVDNDILPTNKVSSTKFCQ